MTEPTVILPSTTLAPGLLAQRIRGVRSHAGRTPQGPPILLGNPGRCPKRPTHTICLCDNSGSVLSGNDSIGRRYEEARLAIERVARRCRCHDELVSIIHFDTPTSGDVIGAQVDRAGWPGIERGLAIPPDGAGISMLGPSLAREYQLVGQFPDHLPIVVGLTDYELFDPSGVLDDFAVFPGLVHAVVLRAAPPTRLVDDDRVTVTVVTYDSPPGVVARSVFDALTTYRPGRKVLHKEANTS